MIRLRTVMITLVIFFVVACGGDDKSKAKKFTNNANNINNINKMPDGGMSDMSMTTCDDGLTNQDETDIDCGGSCDACPNDALCDGDEDCESLFCGDDGFCATAPLALGAGCTDATECASGQCEPFGDESFCTESCTDTCSGQSLACFRDLCTPNTYCEDPDGDGFGEGPGCEGAPCDRCAIDATCNELGDGTFECICNDGFDGDGFSCTDIDECSLDTDDCGENTDCNNTPGSFTCTCSTGYMDNGQSCTDINECDAGTDDCNENATCTNEVGSFLCECVSGFTGNGKICDDENECMLGTDDCDPLAGCVNEAGGFSCGSCPTGYEDTNGDGTRCDDINECTAGTDDCDPLAGCTNIIGGFVCGACPDGYTDTNGDGTQCDDINECMNGTAMCDTNATCTNFAGTFSCDCNTGWTGNGESCTDIDECALDTDNCDPQGGVCFDTDGSFQCACGPGYTGDGVDCNDINECQLGTDTCADVGGVCANNPPGQFSCTCAMGFTGDGFDCTDINECFDGTDNCSDNARCDNETGTFSCACDSGYVGDGVTCTRPGDTCGVAFTIPTSLPHTATGSTTLFENDYQYSDNACPGTSFGEGEDSKDVVYTFTPASTGFYAITLSSDFDAAFYVTTDCDDIDNNCQYAAEEDGGSTDLETASIELTAGTTYYIIVDGGLVGGDEGTYTLTVDPDECADGIDNCPAISTCENTPSGFDCACEQGYELDSTNTSCVDIHECNAGTDNCDPDAMCTNLVGSFECTCNTGFLGDGETCWSPTDPGETCTNPFVIGALPYNTSGDTTDAYDNFEYTSGACPGETGTGGGNAPDETYSFTPTVDADYTFTLTGTDFDSVIYMMTDCADVDGTCVQANDGLSSGDTETFTVPLTAGTTYYFVVDGWNTRDGVYTLDVVCENCP